MNEYEATQVATEMQAAGYSTKLHRWFPRTVTVDAVTPDGLHISIESAAQWEQHKAAAKH